MILDRPARGREPGPLRSPLNTEESTETICKDDWLMGLGDHGGRVIMAVPPTADAMSGIHQQHDPVDVKSLGDAIHFRRPPVRESRIGPRRLRSLGERLDPSAAT